MSYNSPNNYLHTIAAKAHAKAAEWAGLLHTADDGPVHLGSQDTFLHFRSISSSELMSGNYTRPVTITDIETGHNDQVISVAALKGVIDKRTGEFRVVDTYERYYAPDKTHSASFNMSREVHHLTANRIEQLRTLQGATYSNKYDTQEASSLMQFMRGSLVVGHNVEEFDFSRLGIASDLQKEDILDTLVWAENVGIRKGHRGLSKLFKQLTGRSLKQAGYSHHFGFHDVLSNAEVFSAIYRQKGKGGRDVRFVTNNKGYSYGAYEDVAGTAIIRGGYYNGRGHGGPQNYMYEDEFDDRDVFAQNFDKFGNPLGWEYDENGQRQLPDGFSYADELREEGDPTGGFGTIVGAEISSTFRALTEKLQEVREATIGFKVHQQNQMIRYLATKDEDVARQYLKGLKYKEAVIDIMMKQAGPLRIARERDKSWKKAQSAVSQRQKVSSYVNHLYRKGEIGKNDWMWLSDVNNASTGFSPQDVMYMAKERKDEYKDRLKQAHSRVQAREEADLGGWNAYARALNEEDPFSFNRKDALKRIQFLDRAEKYGDITKEQRASLEQLEGSYDDLVDATNEMIKANERLAQTYHALADIKPYDMNNLVGAAHSQWSGIMGAAQGVVPGFILNPINRIGRAYLNRADRSIAPWNAVQRFYNEAVGTPLKKLTGHSSIAGAIGGPVGAGFGVFNAGTQAAGNYMQARLEMKGYDIQNNLNTLGAMISWIATPFKLLHKATKLLIGSFGGLSYKLNSFMGQGIEMMMQMGNPLSTLTGVNYGSYVGTTMMDRVALLNRGSMNATMESFATQQRMFYTMGQVDTNRLIASSMLGVYDKVYSPTNDVQGAYTSMANKLLNDIKTQDPATAARTMALAEQIDKNLPQLLETAKLLDVQDINTLMDPGNRSMYWRPVTSREEQQSMRWTQYEYGAAKDQLGVSKMRVANAMWNNLGGKRIYNAVNEFVDGIAKAVNTGEWDSVVARATEIWQTARDAFDKVWTGLSNSLKGDSDNAIVNTFKAIGLQLENVAITFAQKVVSVWDELTLALLRKVQGAVAYLSTVKIDFDLKDGKLGFKFTSIKDAEIASDNEPIYKQTISALGNITNNPREGMSGYAQLYEQLFPNASDITIANATVGDIRRRLQSLHNQGAPVIGMSALGYEQIGTDDASINEMLLRAARQGWGEAGTMEDAASMFLMKQLYNTHLNKQDVYDKTGIYGVGKQFIDSTEDVVGTLLASKYNDNVAKIDVLIRDTSGKKVMLEADSKGNLMSTNLTLLQQMIPKGIDLVVSQLKGN